jgi:hypothetical protein
MIASFWIGILLKYFFSLIIISMGIKAIATMAALSSKQKKEDKGRSPHDLPAKP